MKQNLLKQKKILESRKKLITKKNNTHNKLLSALEIIGSKKFTKGESISFAKISGDLNPIHINKNFSKKTISGEPIIHGMHMLSYILNLLFKKKKIIANHLRISFLKIILEEEKYNFYYNKKDNQILVTQSHIIFIKLDILISKKEILSKEKQEYVINKRLSIPKNKSFNEIKKLKNQSFKNVCDTTMVKKKFPYLFKAYGKINAAEFFNLSYLVGMECPGLHSLFYEANILMQKSTKKRIYNINNYDERFKLINISIGAKNIQANIKTFLRPAPIFFPAVNKLSLNIKENEFNSIKALIIGGSRGLGSLTAKLIAAGGGEVTLTYNSSKKEAVDLYNEIKEFGSKIKIVKFNIYKSEKLKLYSKNINQCYYYATPKIFSKQNNNFNKNLLNKFLFFYVKIFKKIIKELNLISNDCKFFLPSTVAITSIKDEMLEYAIAKLEAEIMISNFSKKIKDKILISRLPRVLTDQTNTILNIKTVNSIELTLNTIRNLMKK